MTELEYKTLPEKLNECYYLFIEAFMVTINSYSEIEKIKVKEFAIEIAMGYTPYGIMTAQSIGGLVDHVFTVEVNRDFVWKLIFNYFSVIGYDKTMLNHLCTSLAVAVDIGDNTSESNLSLTPASIRERLQNQDVLINTLKDNKWLLVILMLVATYQRKYDNNKTIKEMLET